MADTGYTIGMVTPFSWTVPSSVNRHVAALAAQFTALGHRVTVIAPSDDKAQVREARARVRAVLLEEQQTIFSPDEPFPRFFYAGGTYPTRYKRTSKVIAAPVDLISNIDVLLQAEKFDLLHVHEPFAPSLGWTALRHAACPLVATFHGHSERLRQYWLARPIFQRYFESFDAVLAVSQAARDTASRAFPGEYTVIPGGVDLARFHPAAGWPAGDGGPAAGAAAAGAAQRPVHLLFAGAESHREGLGLLLRALRRLEHLAPQLHLHVCGADTQEQRFAWLVPAAFAERVTFHGRVSDERLAELHRDADIFCAPSLTTESAGLAVLEAMASGDAVVASDLPGYDELIDDGVSGLLVPARRPRALAQALERLVGAPDERAALASAGLKRAPIYGWDVVAGNVAGVYDDVAGRLRRHQRRAVRQRELFADLHVHSNHSKDCTMEVAEVLARARDLGIDVLAITDHNSVDGGLEGRGLAAAYGLRVIVGEEVKTAEGEVIGLFLERAIPAGMSFAATIAAIREQGGVVYVPHPFDRLHTVPSRAVLKANVADLDIVEVFNSRIAFPAFNEQAERFALRYRIPAAAGSDSHVLPGLGTALTAIDDFSGPSDFVAAFADSRIVRRPKSLLYLHGLKFLQTKVDANIGRP
jgi:glycosyltransferase involved in cell wall biosynthesis/predicted metal-dependent phosphoesterase TrpH